MEDFVSSAAFQEYAHRIDAENEMQNERLSKLERTVEEITKLTISVEKMAISMENMTTELRSQGERLTDIESKPGEKWEKLSWVVITALATGILGYILGMVL